MWPGVCTACGVLDHTVCPGCRRTGFVRLEVVIKGKESSLNLDCSYCRHTWQAEDRRVIGNIDAAGRRIRSAKPP